jgi:hypothetical protein
LREYVMAGAKREKFSREHNGKTYHAEYYVEGWTVTVGERKRGRGASAEAGGK